MTYHRTLTIRDTTCASICIDKNIEDYKEGIRSRYSRNSEQYNGQNKKTKRQYSTKKNHTEKERLSNINPIKDALN
jgi:hypothetical protein